MLFRRGGNHKGNSPHTVLLRFTFPHPPTLRLQFRNLDFNSGTSNSIPELQLLSRTLGSGKGNPPLHHVSLLLIPTFRPRFQSPSCRCFVVPLCIATLDAFHTHSGTVPLLIIFHMLPCKVQQLALPFDYNFSPVHFFTPTPFQHS